MDGNGRGSRRHWRLVVLALAVVAALASLSASAARESIQPPGQAPQGSRFGGPHMGGFGQRGPFRPGPHGHGPIPLHVLARAADYLELTPAELGAALKGGKSLAQIATANGKTPAGLVQALVDDAKAGLDAAVAAGWLTQGRANVAVKRLRRAIRRLVYINPKPRPKLPPMGPMGPMVHQGLFRVAGEYLGMTPRELFQGLRSGKSLAELAAEKGKTADGLVDALVAPVKKRLDAAVAAGKLSQAKADEILAAVTKRTKAMVERKGPLLPPMMGGGPPTV